MRFSDEDLIAFLLDDASPDLREKIELHLAAQSECGDTELVDRLMQFRQILGHMDSMSGFFEPPSDLVDGTMERIEQAEAERIVERHASVKSRVGLSASEGMDRRKGSNSRKRMESLVLTVCLGAICCLVLPSIVTARFESRKRGCAHNMLLTGQDLLSYAIQSPDGRYPRVRANGRYSFAGVQPVYLQSAGYEIHTKQLQCPSLYGCQASEPEFVIEAIPDFEQLRQIAVDELAAWQRAIGGDYAYNLGIQAQRGDTVSVMASRCEGRFNYAILADAPVLDDSGEKWIAHDGRGINMMFEDGRIIFVSLPSNSTASPMIGRQNVSPDNARFNRRGVFPGDHPFRNIVGQHAAGLNEDDMCLAPSHVAPVAYK